MLISEIITILRHEVLVDANASNVWLNYSDDMLLDLIRLNAPKLQKSSGAFLIPKNNTSAMSYELEDYDSSMIYMLMRIDLLNKLSLSTAKNYPLQAEGAGLRKDYIFNHYKDLLDAEREAFKSEMKMYKLGRIKSTTVSLVNHKFYDAKLANDKPKASLIAVKFEDGSIKVDWDRFIQTSDSYFYKYAVYLSKAEIYDKYTNTFSNDYISVKEYYDPEQLALRFTGMEIGNYIVSLIVKNSLGQFGIATATVAVT